MPAEFVGEYFHNFDQKNRLFIPSKFRGGLGERFMVTKPLSGEKCIYIYPEAEWDAFMASVTENLSGARLTLINRLIYHETDRVEPDKQGRVTIRQDFCEFAELENGAYFLGAGKKIELWNEKNFTAMMAEAMKDGMFNLKDIGY